LKERSFLKKTVEELRPDVLHAGPITGPAWIGALISFHPLVSMSWGSDLLLDAQKGLKRIQARYVLEKSAVVLGDCKAVEKVAIALGTDPKRVIAFPWGIDLEQFTPGEDQHLRKELGWKDALVVLSTRSWEPIYGVDIAVEGFLKAAKQNDGLRLILLGDGSMSTQISQKIQQSGMADRVYTPGRIAYENLLTYYHAADVYLSASHSDGSSVSLLEAMASGLPAIVSDIPGNREWVVPGGTGWWFRDADSQELSQVLESLRSGVEMEKKGFAARKVVTERADWRLNFPKLLDAYDLALKVDAR
jgi:glycosyltransferase involved in cell wall biosynthesis